MDMSDGLAVFGNYFICSTFSQCHQRFFLVAPLLASMVILIAILLRRGFTLKSLTEMAVVGSQKSFSVIAILLLIGAVIAALMAAITVPVLLDWAIKSIDAHYFIFEAFILTSVISVLL